MQSTFKFKRKRKINSLELKSIILNNYNCLHSRRESVNNCTVCFYYEVIDNCLYYHLI